MEQRTENSELFCANTGLVLIQSPTGLKYEGVVVDVGSCEMDGRILFSTMAPSDNAKDRIKEEIDIVELIGDYLPLKKAGKNYRTNCPFHQDDTPSFYVSPELNMFHCFGCGKSGDIITFVMEYEKVPFIEALRILADRAGIPLKSFSGENEILYDIHDFATEFYHRNLLESKKVLNYLKKRGIDIDTVKEFKLGFAPYGSSFLKEAKKEFKVDDLVKSGLVKKSRGELKDRFFLRLLFPLFSTSGRIIGFGGRRLSKKGPKYLNSPDTPIHRKGKNLYSLWHAKNSIREKNSVILVEGYFDFLSLYREGIKNSVACLGTSLTQNQAELLSRYAEEVIIFFDRDAAGQAATLRSLGMLLNEGADIRIGQTGEKKDPDDIIQDEGVEKFLNLAASATNFVEWTLGRIREKYPLSNPSGISKAIDEIIPLLSGINDRTKRELYREEVSKKLGIRQDLIRVDRKKSSSEIKKKSSLLPEREEFEILLVYSLVSQKEVNESIFELIDEEDIKNPHLKKWFRMLKKGEETTPEKLSESLPDKLLEYLVKKSQEPDIPPEECALNFRRFLLSEKIEEKRRALQKVEENGEEGTELLQELQELIQEREKLCNREL